MIKVRSIHGNTKHYVSTS